MAENQDITIVGGDSHFRGELTFERAARINGKFDGRITGKGELHVNDNALAKADVEAGTVNVDGRIEGNVNAKDTIRLNAKGTIKGDIVAAKMIMAEGASFFGQCAVGPEAQKQGGGPGGPGGPGRPGGVPPTGGAPAQPEPPKK